MRGSSSAKRVFALDDPPIHLRKLSFLLDCRIKPGNDKLHRLHPIMADAPFAAVGVAEQACGGEEEPAPAAHPQSSVVAVDRAQNGFNLIAIGIEIRQPI